MSNTEELTSTLERIIALAEEAERKATVGNFDFNRFFRGVAELQAGKGGDKKW